VRLSCVAPHPQRALGGKKGQTKMGDGAHGNSSAYCVSLGVAGLVIGIDHHLHHTPEHKAEQAQTYGPKEGLAERLAQQPLYGGFGIDLSPAATKG
jgi:hypothetical protein